MLFETFWLFSMSPNLFFSRTSYRGARAPKKIKSYFHFSFILYWLIMFYNNFFYIYNVEMSSCRVLLSVAGVWQKRGRDFINITLNLGCKKSEKIQQQVCWVGIFRFGQVEFTLLEVHDKNKQKYPDAYTQTQVHTQTQAYTHTRRHTDR